MVSLERVTTGLGGYTTQFQSLLASAEITLLRLPARSLNLNAFAERFVRSIKEECLRHIIPLGERHLRIVVGNFIEHYHTECNHQGLGNVIPFPSAASPPVGGRIRRRTAWADFSTSTNERQPEAYVEYWDTTPTFATIGFGATISAPYR
jgi:hypothetical protein